MTLHLLNKTINKIIVKLIFHLDQHQILKLFIMTFFISNIKELNIFIYFKLH